MAKRTSHKRHASGLTLVLILLLAPRAFLVAAQPSLPPQPAAAKAPSFQGTVTDIRREFYFPEVQSAFRNAKESIVVTMYMIRLYPDSRDESRPLILLRELVAARKRGVEVTVILNNAMRYHKGKQTVRVKHKRNTAVDMLEKGGVDVRYHTVSDILHQKLIVIDSAIVITGSHNWSQAALKRNAEHSVMIESKEYAKRTLEYIAGLPLKPKEFDPETPGASVKVPLQFLHPRKRPQLCWPCIST